MAAMKKPKAAKSRVQGTERKVGAREIEKSARRASHANYILKLYVAGVSRRSSEAIRSITEICEKHLKGRYELRIIDIYQQPALAKGEQIIAAPTLIKKLPLPLRRLIGNMANAEKVLVGLDLRPRG
jgi:circadian clock protein KaiB